MRDTDSEPETQNIFHVVGLWPELWRGEYITHPSWQGAIKIYFSYKDRETG